MTDLKAFIAYPARPAVIGQTIELAVVALPEQAGRGLTTAEGKKVGSKCNPSEFQQHFASHSRVQ